MAKQTANEPRIATFEPQALLWRRNGFNCMWCNTLYHNPIVPHWM